MICSNEIPQKDGYYWAKLQSTWSPQIIEYVGGIACCDFGEDVNGKHAIGIGLGVDRQCALITLDMLEIIDWSDDYFKIVNRG